LEIERGSTRPHSVEDSLWKGQWTCRETDNAVNERFSTNSFWGKKYTKNNETGA